MRLILNDCEGYEQEALHASHYGVGLSIGRHIGIKGPNGFYFSVTKNKNSISVRKLPDIME